MRGYEETSEGNPAPAAVAIRYVCSSSDSSSRCEIEVEGARHVRLSTVRRRRSRRVGYEPRRGCAGDVDACNNVGLGLGSGRGGGGGAYGYVSHTSRVMPKEYYYVRWRAQSRRGTGRRRHWSGIGIDSCTNAGRVRDIRDGLGRWTDLVSPAVDAQTHRDVSSGEGDARGPLSL
ncbi:hypothetical protein B0H16DRAFT_1532996 [Mycena metata]|uniref:Uncharacterized protein n=1 Tax=Mycena metata TaxID=1033252 RepID=A0AAD7JD53_9AGAR|nr:hypothetical protein B0H16DRAFT_1532996 [Mycena metata]